MNILQLLANMLNSHAERCICAPPCPALYWWNLVVTSASWDWRWHTVNPNKVCSDSIRNEQVKTSACRINFDGISTNV